MPVVTLTSLDISTISSSQVVHLKWRNASDPDVSGSYTTLPNATVNSSGVITSPSPYTFTVPYNNIYLRATNDCSTSTFDKEYYISQCCPDGYTPSSGSCYKITQQSATYVGGGSPITVCHYTNVNYSQYGTLIYKSAGYNQNGTYTTGNTPAGTLKTAAVGGTYAGTLWANPSSNTTDGRMNKTALWNCSSQTYVGTIGFGFQITIPTTGTYYIGFGADNRATLMIDGTTLIAQDDAALGTQSCGGSSHTECAFKYWHVYPISLIQGVHLISVSGTNDSSVGAFGCEIYNATEAQLTACTTATGSNGDTALASTNLHRYIIFSTKDITDATNSDAGNYTCSTGYTLINSGGTYSCQQIATASLGTCMSSKVGSLVAPNSQATTVAPLYGINTLRATYNANAPTVSYQTYSNAGYEVVLTYNNAAPNTGASFPTGSDLTTYTNGLNTFLSGNAYNFNVLCFQNEENNQSYWDGSASDYLGLLSNAISVCHANGRKASNGGMTGQGFKWMVWKDLYDNQGATVANTWAAKVFDSTGMPMTNWDTVGSYHLSIQFLQTVIPAYATMALDYVNFHWYEPSHPEILSETSIDPTGVLTAISYVERITGKRAIINELGQLNTNDNIMPQTLAALMDVHMPYILMYDGDGAMAGTGDSYALHNADTTLRNTGLAVKAFLKSHK